MGLDLKFTTFQLADEGCDSKLSSDSGDSDDNNLPPLLEPQIPELNKRKLRENPAKNVVLKPKLKDRSKNMKYKKKECGSQTEETAFSRLVLPSSSSASSAHGSGVVGMGEWWAYFKISAFRA